MLTYRETGETGLFASKTKIVIEPAGCWCRDGRALQNDGFLNSGFIEKDANLHHRNPTSLIPCLLSRFTFLEGLTFNKISLPLRS